MLSLTVLREQNEAARFERQRVDDSRTAIPPEAARELEAVLRRRLRGEVRFDAGSRALYATDGSNYRQAPIGVVIPCDKDDVVATVEEARRFGAPILGRGCGTSLAGQCCNVAVVMDFSKYMNRVVKIDAEQKLGTVEPGCVLDSLRDAAKQHGLNFGPDPATHTHCTLGGMLGNDSCGSHSLLSKNNGLGLRCADNTAGMEVLTYEGLRLRVGPTTEEQLRQIIAAGGPRGELYQKIRDLRDKYADEIRSRMPKLGRRVSGYNLDDLLPERGFNLARALVGSESTLAVTLEATLHLVPNPPARSLVVMGYPDVYEAASHVMQILEHKPTALEGMDHLLFDWVKQRGRQTASIDLMPPGKGFLLVEFGGASKEESDANARRCMEMLKKQKNPPDMELLDDPEREEMIWKVREGGLGATTWVPGHADTWPGWEDSAVPVEKVEPYLRDLRKLFGKYGYHPSLYGHFGQGCIHCRVGFDLYTTDGIRKFRDFMQEAAGMVTGYGGSLSGEHGDGQARGEFLPVMFGEKLMQAFREFKAVFDPQGKMNPGKKIDAYPADMNLRIGADYNPPQPDTHFRYADDKHSFARAALRCVGVGNCRQHEHEVMCPSYRVTREEKHSTRGRARLLFEMLNGEILTDGWRSEEVKDALDLCLACKGCKHDCPVSVDMATYKAEFYSHYYEGRLRPRHAYSMGWVYWWSRLASLAPGLVNLVSQTPGLSNVAKFLGGIDQRRRIPPFAPETFKAWFARRGVRNQGRPPVILWPDTFNNYLHPEVGKATVEVLENAGYQVWVPRASLCCGRPLYDFGMLDDARSLLRQAMHQLRPYVQQGVPLVGMEPSCAAVFRDELGEMFPENEDAKRLQSQTYVLSEFLTQVAKDYTPPRLERKAVGQGHCHHKSVMTMKAEEELLKKMGLDVRWPESSCCGMAGSFGFEAGQHYDVAMACGERHLLPAVREASDDTLILADGFSCQSQIEQGTDRQALHLAQVLQMALRQSPAGVRGPFPERHYPKVEHVGRSELLTAGVAVGAGALLAGGLLWLGRNGNGVDGHAATTDGRQTVPAGSR
jgi:FAD/FMN-containing dehydrogenase/Fe-S oxidoreductase